jgi:predicted N-acetyltransferase YhbS
MGRVTVRRATSTDGPPVRRLVFGILVDYGIAADPDDSDADVMEFGASMDTRVLHLVAELEGRVVGSVIMAPAGHNGDAKLSRLFVAPAVRRRGIGRSLLHRAMEEARRAGYSCLEINTRGVYREAVQMYETTGWRRGADRPGPGPDRVYRYPLAST